MAIRIILYLTLLAFHLDAKTSELDKTLQHLLSEESVIRHKQIKIPGYPRAYNPSLIPYKDGYLLSFRYTSRRPEMLSHICRTDLSFIGIAKLDKNFKVSPKSVQLLNIVSHSPKLSLSAEDARLLDAEGRIYLFFNDSPRGRPDGFAMYFGRLVEENGIFQLKEPAKPLNYSYAEWIEKNWTPFISNGRIHVIYSDRPRIVLEVDEETGECSEVMRTYPNWDWKHGLIRGGTPAYLVNGRFLTFFHSSFPAKIQKGRAYVMGAYTFDAEPPFTARTLTPTPLGELAYYTEDNDPKVIFPGGLVVQDQSILVAWGKADKEIYITTFDKRKLLSSLNEVR